MGGVSEWTISSPHDRQKLFLSDKHRYVGYGGARGGGKSWAIDFKCILLARRWPGIRICIVRHTYKELRDNHIEPIQRMMPHGSYRYNDSNKVITFPNGSTISFQYCASDKDLGYFQGVQFDVLFIDEATQFTEYQFKAMNASVRGVNNFPHRTYITCNPGGVGHQWVKRLFLDRRCIDGEDPAEYSFIHAGVKDNLALMESDPEYIKGLEALPPKLRKAWLDGDWDVYEGQFFEEFIDRPDLDSYTHVIEPFDIPDNWKIYRSFDWGYARPFSCGWWSVSEEGVVYRILELYGCTKTPNEGVKWIPDKVFEEIHRIETEHRWLRGKHIIGVADPAIWDAQTGESIADTAAKHQVWFKKGDHQRIPGWLQMHYYMAFDENGKAMMYIFKNCKAFIRTIPLLQYDEHRVEDIDTDGEDHVADETRYFLMTRPIKPRMPMAKDEYYESPQHLFLDIPKDQVMRKRPKKPTMEVIDDG